MTSFSKIPTSWLKQPCARPYSPCYPFRTLLRRGTLLVESLDLQCVAKDVVIRQGDAGRHKKEQKKQTISHLLPSGAFLAQARWVLLIKLYPASIFTTWSCAMSDFPPSDQQILVRDSMWKLTGDEGYLWNILCFPEGTHSPQPLRL